MSKPSKQERQKALDEISAEELAKVKAHQASTSGAMPVDQEWLLLAEFARVYGWDAYKAVRNDEIELDEMLTLIEANRRLEFKDEFRDTESAFIGAVSAQTKNPSNTYKTLTKGIIKKTKADE